MASMVQGTLNPRHCATIQFPERSAGKLIGYYGPGPLQLFDRSDVPERAYLWSSHKALADFVVINAKMTICPEIKEVIEALEPGRHQFFAVEIARGSGKKPIFRLDGRELMTPYYLFNSSVRLDAVWIEKSEVKVHTTSTQPTLVFELPYKEERIVLRRDIISGHHVWTGGYQLGNSMFFSDTLTQIVSKKKWKGLEFKHLQEE
jgi:hypothetical protein